MLGSQTVGFELGILAHFHILKKNDQQCKEEKSELSLNGGLLKKKKTLHHPLMHTQATVQ